MNVTELISPTGYAGVGLFLVVCISLFWLMQRRNYIVLLLWPIIIYFCGPIFTGMFVEAPVLSRYVFPDLLLPETLTIFVYFITILFADRLFDISSIIRSSLASPVVGRLSNSPVYTPMYVLTAIAAVVLQIKMLRDFGSVLSGSYVLANVADGLIPYWGFLAGLYELIFLLFVLALLNKDIRRSRRVIIIGLYCLTAVLRVGGGTRLVLIKEVAFLVLLFYLRGGIAKRKLGFAVFGILVAGTGVGLLRNGVDDVVFGPFYGLVMESALDALTLNIAYHVQASGFVATNGDLLQTLLFVFLSAVPSFVRFWITQPQLDALSPYNLAMQFGFDTSMPVGGMSGFATICYISSYPIFSTFCLAITIGIIFRYAPSSTLKQIVVLVFCINSIHFWRDPVDIAVKLVVQGVVCALVLLGILNASRVAGGLRIPNTHPAP